MRPDLRVVDGCRSVDVEGELIPLERIVIDPAALNWACDHYAEQTGDVDEVALGGAVLLYMEAARS